MPYDLLEPEAKGYDVLEPASAGYEVLDPPKPLTEEQWAKVKPTAYEIIGRDPSQAGNDEFLRSVVNDPVGFFKSLPGSGLALATAPGKLAYYTAADAMSKLSEGDPGWQEYGGNLKALMAGRPLPVDKFLATASQTNPNLTTAAKVGQSLSAMSPLAAVGFLPAAAQKLVAAGFSLQMILAAPEQFKQYAEEINKPPAEQNPDKLTTLQSDIIQTFAFAPLAGDAGSKLIPKGRYNPVIEPIKLMHDVLFQEKPAEPLPIEQPIAPPEITPEGQAPRGPDITEELGRRGTLPSDVIESPVAEVTDTKNVPVEVVPPEQSSFPVGQSPRGPEIARETVSAAEPETPPPPTVPANEGQLTTVRPGQLGKGIATNEAVQKIKAEIAETGKVMPVEIEPNGNIVDGEHRYKALMELGVQDIPVYVGKQLGSSGRLEHPYDGIRVNVKVPVDTIADKSNALLDLARRVNPTAPESVTVKDVQLWHDARKTAGQIPEPVGEVPGTRIAASGAAAPVPEIIGMGGAVPGEFERSAGTAVGVKVAAIDAQRAARGEEPLTSTARRSFSNETWVDTLAKVDNNPEAPAQLVQELTDKPRSLMDHDVALLLYRQADLNYQRARVTRDMAQALEDSHQFPDRRAAYDSSKLDMARVQDELDALDRAVRPSSSETGRGLAALRNMVGDNYTLEALEFGRQAAKGGEPLTDAERIELVKLRDEIATAREAQAAALDKDAVERAQRMADETIASLKNELDLRPNYHPQIFKIAEEIVGKLNKRADAARVRVREKLMRMSAGVDPTLIYDLGEIGAAKLAEFGLDRAKWGAEMVKEFSGKISHLLDDVWTRSNLVLDNEGAKYGDKSDQVKNLLRKRDAASRETNIEAGLKKAVADGAPLELQGDYIRRLMENFIRKGITAREPVVDAIHSFLKDRVGMKDVTRRDVMEAMSGYGQFKALNPDAIKVQARDIRGQIQQVLKLEDILARQPLLKTGLERRTPSTEERLLQQQVNEAKRRFGVVVSDPARQLKSALDARKTALKNRISDLEFQIANRERSVKTKTAVPLDAAGELLKLKVADLNKQLDEIAPKPGLTDDQRAAVALRSVEREIKLAEVRIKGGEVWIRERKPGITTPELTALRARLEALRAEEKDLREATDKWQRQNAEKQVARQAENLQASIALKEKQLAAGPQPPADKPVNRPADPRLEALMQHRDALNRQLADARKLPPNVRKLEALNNAIAKVQAKIARGDYGGEPKPQAMNRPMSPELEVAKQQLELLNRQLADLRNPPKSPEELAMNAYLTRLTRQYADLLERASKEDFTPRTRRVQAWRESPQVQTAVAAVQRAKRVYELGNAKARNDAMTRMQRAAKILLRIRREFVLSGLGSLEKLANYSLVEMLATPFKEAVGVGLSKLPFVREVAAKSPSEVGFNVRNLLNDYKSAFTTGIKDAATAWREGGSALKLAYDPRVIAEGEFKSFFGTLHQMEKSPLMRMVHDRSYTRRMEFAERMGQDITDTALQQRFHAEAMQDALNAALINRSALVGKVNRFVNSLAEKDKVTGRESTAGKVARFVFTAETPVQHVPVNFVARTAEYAFGLASGSYKIASAFRRGIETLQPAEADIIMRHLKNGSVGAAAMALGFLVPAMFGGFYTPGQEKRKLKPGEIMVGGHVVSRYITHHPLLNAAQFGATLAQVANSKLRRKDVETQGIGAGAKAALFGLADETPYVRELESYADLRDPKQWERVMGDKLKGYFAPQFVQNVAEWRDKNAAGEPIERKASTVWQHVEMGIPGLRQNVPEKPSPGTLLGAEIMRGVRGPLNPSDRQALRKAVENRLRLPLSNSNSPASRIEESLRFLQQFRSTNTPPSVLGK